MGRRSNGEHIRWTAEKIRSRDLLQRRAQSTNRKVTLHPRTRPGEEWQRAQGRPKPLSNRIPNISPKGILELKPQKKSPMTQF